MRLRKAIIVVLLIQLFWMYWLDEQSIFFKKRITSMKNDFHLKLIDNNHRHLRFACMGKSKSGFLWYMRCKQLVFYGKLFLKDVSIDELTYEEAANAKTSYDGAIFIKETPKPEMWPIIKKKFRNIYLDVVDGGISLKGYEIDFKFLKMQDPPPVLIVQNVYQQKLYNDTFKTVIIEHMPASLNQTELVDVLSFRHPLQAVSTMEGELSRGVCEEIKTKSVLLKCLSTDNGNTLRKRRNKHRKPWNYGAKKVLEKELNVKYADYAPKIWGVPWLFTQLFRKYDVVVVFTKKGEKLTINSAQRMTNAINAGVITVIQRTGVHAIYVPESYPCGFINQNDLKIVLEKLDQNVSMRIECQKQAVPLINPFRPKTIINKYYDMLTYNLNDHS